jgi:lipoprotein-releasing system permease protein
VGAATGLAAGTALCVFLEHNPVVELPKEIYYLDRLPVQMSWQDTGMVFAMAVLLSLVSSFYPAWTAGKLDPVKALRYE